MTKKVPKKTLKWGHKDYNTRYKTFNVEKVAKIGPKYNENWQKVAKNQPKITKNAVICHKNKQNKSKIFDLFWLLLATHLSQYFLKGLKFIMKSGFPSCLIKAGLNKYGTMGRLLIENLTDLLSAKSSKLQ